MGDINAGTWSIRFEVGCKADDLVLQKKYCCEIQRTGKQNEFCILAEYSKEGHGSKRTVLPMMMMMMMRTE
jgi:hypothetical protein